MARSRSAAAKVWATVLSELAGVPVVVEWESPSWRVRWVDGPTRALLSERAAALSGYGVGSPLAAEQLMFSRRVSPVAAAVGWLFHGSRATEVEQRQGMTAEYAVQQWSTDTSYPQQRAGDAVVAAARVLAAVSRGDAAMMTALMTSALPPVDTSISIGRVIGGLPGTVVSYRWPGRGGPPPHLLQPPEEAPATHQPTGLDEAASVMSPPVPHPACRRCGTPLPGRPAARGDDLPSTAATGAGSPHTAAAQRRRFRNRADNSVTGSGRSNGDRWKKPETSCTSAPTWYKYPPTPGQIGPTVILGHVDSAKYGPGVFFKLGALQPGATVEVTLTDRIVAVFTVDKVVAYPKSAFPPPRSMATSTTRSTFDHLRRNVRPGRRKLRKQHRRLRHFDGPPPGHLNVHVTNRQNPQLNVSTSKRRAAAVAEAARTLLALPKIGGTGAR